MIRSALVALLLPLQVAAEDLPSWSMAGGFFLAECAAIFSLLTPVEPDELLSAQFKAAEADLMDQAMRNHGTSFANKAFALSVEKWQSHEPTLQGNVDLAQILSDCKKRTNAF